MLRINPCLGFPDSSVGKESAYSAGDPGMNPELGRSPGEGKGYSLQYSGPENSMDSTVQGVYKELDMTERLSLSLLYLNKVDFKTWAEDLDTSKNRISK